jgi:hemoglobin
MVSEAEVYGLIGDEGFTRLVAAFYRRIPTDDILGPMYKGVDLAAAERRLRLFLIGRFNGPQSYVMERGHPRLRMRHAPFKVDTDARDRWLKLMGEALDETGLPPEVEPILRAYFASTAQHMVNYAAEGG